MNKNRANGDIFTATSSTARLNLLNALLEFPYNGGERNNRRYVPLVRAKLKRAFPATRSLWPR